MAPEGHDLLRTQMLRPDVIEQENDAAALLFFCFAPLGVFPIGTTGWP